MVEPSQEPAKETVAIVEGRSPEIDSLRLQMEYRWRLMKFLLIAVTSFSVFSFLTIVTGITYEYTSDRGDKFSYHFPTDELVKLLSVPVVATIATAIAGATAKDRNS